MNTNTELPQEFYVPKVVHYKEREECLIDIVKLVLILGYLKINILKKTIKNLPTENILMIPPQLDFPLCWTICNSGFKKKKDFPQLLSPRNQ